MITVGVPKETAPGERRVALTPDAVKELLNRGLRVVIEAGAGEAAPFTDQQYLDAGAEVLPNPKDVYSASDIILRVNGPKEANGSIEHMKPGAALVAMFDRHVSLDTIRVLAAQGVTAFALNLIPRISRAQSMDALSSMSTIAGYKAVVLAAERLPRFFPMLMTAAGTLPPARVFVVGAGVAGLQAIATARRLGALVEAFDVRPAVKEQVESLGARFVGLPEMPQETEDTSGYAKEVSEEIHQQELQLIAERLPKRDVVITTALVPGKRAPILITLDGVRTMQPGSVIVDLAAPAGGNCEATLPGETVVVEGVTIVGNTDLISTMAMDASRMYSKNLIEFLRLLIQDGALAFDVEDEIIAGTMLTHDRRIVHEPTRLVMEEE
ncbi:MAG: NAD(P)(+) transhydrogenase (Re/Si-specific) subunit alpha [Armatimonadota bacterium]